MPLPLDAFTETRSRGMPRRAAIVPRMASRYGPDAGAFGDQRDVDVQDLRAPRPLEGLGDETGGGRVLPLRVRRPEDAPEVAGRGGPKEGVREGVENDVAVGVPLGPGVGRDLDPAEDAAAPRDERVGVEPLADPQAHGRPSAASHASARARSSG